MTGGTNTKPAPPTARAATGVVFFDGLCVLCNRSMQFFIERDRRRVLRFAPLQGETFERVRPSIDVPDGIDSIVYVRGFGTERHDVFVHSGAVLQVLHDIGGFWRVVSWLRVVPRSLRDCIYRWIARHRYRWFGKYDACHLPTPEDREQLMP